jgi:hypothetical protein
MDTDVLCETFVVLYLLGDDFPRLSHEADQQKLASTFFLSPTQEDFLPFFLPNRFLDSLPISFRFFQRRMIS